MGARPDSGRALLKAFVRIFTVRFLFKTGPWQWEERAVAMSGGMSHHIDVFSLLYIYIYIYILRAGGLTVGGESGGDERRHVVRRRL